MGYEAYLWRMLEPLGVYGKGGYSGAELKALGAALDEAASVISENLLEMLVMTAGEDGLEKARELFPFHGDKGTPREIRSALQILHRMDHGAFTEADLEETFGALGLNLGITVEGPEWVTVVFREEITQESDIVQALYLVEQVLPAHIYVECSLRYTDKNGAIQNVKERLDLLRKRTKAEWSALIQ